MSESQVLKSIKKNAICEVPIHNGYMYGVIISGDLSRDKYDPLYIRFYQRHYQERAGIVELKNLFHSPEECSIVVEVQHEGFTEGEWRIILGANDSFLCVEDRLSEIPFVAHELSGSYYSKDRTDVFKKAYGDALTPFDEMEEITEAEAATIPNPADLFGYIAMEELLYDYANGHNILDMIRENKED